MRAPLVTVLAAAALAGAAPASAQIDLRNPYGSSGEGKIYGLEVAGLPNVVFVVDFSGSMES